MLDGHGDGRAARYCRWRHWSAAVRAPSWSSWLRAAMRDPNSPIHLPRGLTLGALTGQDKRALDGIATCWMLYAGGDLDAERGALEAIRALLPALQPHCRPFARELIAWALDWPDRERLWPQVSEAGS